MKSLKKLDIDKVLGEVFKEYRVKNKLTQEKIAEKLGISVKYISRIENGTGGVKVETLVNYMNGLDGVRKVNQSKDVANTLTDFNKLISYVSAGIILILLCVAVFLISNTVATGIAVRKEEIGIMKLIGATDFLVRAPFVVEGIVIGFVGAAIPLVLLSVLYGRICEYIAEKFNFIGNMMTFVSTNTIFSTLIPVALALGVGIGFVGSCVTIRKHLRV